MKILVIFIFLYFNSVNSTLSQSDKKVKKETLTKKSSGTSGSSVYAKGLVTTKINSKNEILDHFASYYQDVKFRNFDGTVLGYVTPWNGHGYDIAKVFGGFKIQLVSPVWLQIQPSEDSYKIAGLHDKDSKWLGKLSKNGM